MSSSGSVASVYVHVVEDVVGKMREEFVSSGAGDSALVDLQARWELKMMQCGVIPAAADRTSGARATGPITPVHDLNVPYEATEEYETPTAEMLFPPTPLQTPMRTPLPGNVEPTMYQYLPASPSEFGPAHDSGDNGDASNGKPSPYMPPPSPWMNQRPQGVDVNVAYEVREEEEHGISHPAMTKNFFTMNGTKRKRETYSQQVNHGGYIPQQDGSGDVEPDSFLLKASQGAITLAGMDKGNSEAGTQVMEDRRTTLVIPQQDGIHDDYEDGFANEDYNAPLDHDLHATHGTPQPGQSAIGVGDDDDDEPPLNEDDDDDIDEFDQGADNADTHHLVLSQFEKVTRTKNRWKCTLKCGIMRINDKDILFNKANGEFDF
ncbi:uncharacterized protein LOC116255163 [Nymphaea colorata]|nr:uncharacterized protein LOC116255163 [Nymphaea colorata]